MPSNPVAAPPQPPPARTRGLLLAAVAVVAIGTVCTVVFMRRGGGRCSEGYRLDDTGQCVPIPPPPPPVPVPQRPCRNLPDVQEQIPDGMAQDNDGGCYPDLCPEILGLQRGATWDDYVKCPDGKCYIGKCPSVPDLGEQVPHDVTQCPDGGCYVDLCPEIPELQRGGKWDDYVKDSDGKCYIDKCHNLAGKQPQIPRGMIQDLERSCCSEHLGLQWGNEWDDHVKGSDGLCHLDRCHNLAGMQEQVPPKMLQDEKRNCCSERLGLQWGNEWDDQVKGSDRLCHIDRCHNLDGMQEQIPPGMIQDEKRNCCSERPGLQWGNVWDDYVRGSDGLCCHDRCRNILGCQQEIPANLELNERKQCIKKDLFEGLDSPPDRTVKPMPLPF